MPSVDIHNFCLAFLFTYTFTKIQSSIYFFKFIFWAADGFVVQTGDPEGPAEGFIDPSTEKTRTIPLEIMVDGEKAPVYGETLEVILSCLPLLGHVYFCTFVSHTSLYDQKK